MVNEWNKTALVAEFETMLRRRLRSGAAPVAACAGFDLDAASAYLEGALGGSQRAGYESHLAGCVTCRHHLIELARLAQAAPLAEPQPAATPDRISIWARLTWACLSWARLKESVAGWFDLSSPGFRWRIAGMTGAAFAMLISAIGAQSWRRSSEPPVVATAANAVASASLERMVQPLQFATPEAPLPEPEVSSIALDDRNPIATPQKPLQAPAPKPLVGPQVNDPKFSYKASDKALAMTSNQPGEAPVTISPTPTPAASEAAYAPAPASVVVAKKQSKAAGGLDWSDPKEELGFGSRRLAASVTNDPVQVLRPSPPPGCNLMNPCQPQQAVRHPGLSFLGGPQAKSNPEPIIKSDKLARLRDIYGFVKSKWPFNSDSEKESIHDSQESPDVESKGMVWSFRGKVFVFDRSMWIDQEYKPDMQEWRTWALRRGSDEYNRVLASEPLLKDFFDHGPILIVWKNQIYKVQK